MDSKERKRAEYMYNLGKQSTKLSKKGKREFGKIIKTYKGRAYISLKKKRLPKRLTLICFTHKSGDWLCWWRDEKEADREFKKNMKKFKNKGKTGTSGKK